MTRTKSIALAIVLALAGAGAIALYPSPYVGCGLILAGLLIFFIGAVPIKGLTPLEWRRTRRKNFSEDAILVSSSRHGNGIIINGADISLFLELTGSPYQLNRGESEHLLPLETISNFFTTAGARLRRITVHSIAQRSSGTNAFSKIYIGRLPKKTISNIRTIVEVTFRLDETTHEVYRRAAIINEKLDDDSVTVGVTRFAESIAATLRNALIADNIHCHVLSDMDVALWHKNVDSMIGYGMTKPTRNLLPGSKASPAVRMFISPTEDVSPAITRATDAVLISRQLEPDGKTVRTRTIVGMVANNGAPPKSINSMTVALRQQYACGTVVDPTRKTEHVEGSWGSEAQGSLDAEFPLSGAGVRLGTSAIKNRNKTNEEDPDYIQGKDTVFMTLSGARGTTVWCSIPPLILIMTIFRLESAGEKVFFLTGSSDQVEELKRYNIDAGRTIPPGTTVVIVDKGMPTTASPAHMTLALTNKPPRSSLYSIVSDETGNTVIRARGIARRVFWTSTSDERAFLQ